MFIDSVATAIKEQKVKVIDFALGPRYGYVEIEKQGMRNLGVAYFPSEDMSRGMANIPSIEKIPEFVASDNVFHKTLGIAMINAISQQLIWSENLKIEFENLVGYIANVCHGEKIGVIGNMVPLVQKLEKKFEVYVFERNPRFRYGVYPDTMESRYLPKVDAVIISGTTLVNDTFDTVIALSHNARFKALVGPTAGVHPKFLRGLVNIVAGMRINDIDKVKQIVKLGGGRWDFSEYCSEYVVKTENII